MNEEMKDSGQIHHLTTKDICDGRTEFPDQIKAQQYSINNIFTELAYF